MNAGGVAKACKSNEIIVVAILQWLSGKRERNTLVTYPIHGNNIAKAVLMPDGLVSRKQD